MESTSEAPIEEDEESSAEQLNGINLTLTLGNKKLRYTAKDLITPLFQISYIVFLSFCVPIFLSQALLNEIHGLSRLFSFIVLDDPLLWYFNNTQKMFLSSLKGL